MKFSSLVSSQFRQELRSGEQIVLGVTFAIILGALTFLTLASAYLDAFTIQKIIPALYWILFLFSATVTVGRLFEADLEFKALDSIRILLKDKEEIYFFTKFIFSCVLVFFIGGILLATVFLFCPVRLETSVFSGILKSLILVVPGYAALSVIISALLAQHRLRAILLPCLLFPLLTPMLFGAVELTFSLANKEVFLTASPWFWLLGLTATAYPLLGGLLFASCLEE